MTNCHSIEEALEDVYGIFFLSKSITKLSYQQISLL